MRQAESRQRPADSKSRVTRRRLPAVGCLPRRSAAPGSSLDASRTAEPDRHFGAVQDDRYVPAPPGHGEHAIERRSILLDVDVLELDTPPDMVLTGGQRVGSRVLAEDVDHRFLGCLRASLYPTRLRCSFLGILPVFSVIAPNRPGASTSSMRRRMCEKNHSGSPRSRQTQSSSARQS